MGRNIDALDWRGRRCWLGERRAARQHERKRGECGSEAHGSAFLIALGGTVPQQHMAAGVGLEQVGAQRIGKSRIVDLHRDKGTGALACAVPASADLAAGFPAHGYALGPGRGGPAQATSVTCATSARAATN